MDLNGLYTTLTVVVNAISGIAANLTRPDSGSAYFPQIGSGAITDGLGHPIDGGTGTNAQARATIDIISVQGWGYDEWRANYDPATQPPGDTYAGPGAPLGSVIYEVKGTRYINVQIKVECFDQVGAGAFVFLEQIRTRLYLPSVKEQFYTVGFGIQTIEPSTSHDYDDTNGRRVDVALFEVIFNAFDQQFDDPATTVASIVMPKPAAGPIPTSQIVPLT